jgi:perosamine synthetase
MKIPITRPYIDDEEAVAVNEVLKSGWLAQGPKVAEFEKVVCQYTGAKFARASTSCTTALHLGLVALGIGPGDEVLLPSFTFIATSNVVEYTGARPVFIDIDLKTFNIDPTKVEEYLDKVKKRGSKVKAIMPVHLFGLCADMDTIMKLAKQHNLCVIEDAACALGSLYGSKHAGTFGDVGCLSFHPRKSITTGEGGMLITDNPEIALKVQSLRDHGASTYDLAIDEKQNILLPSFDQLGYNYRMTDIQGAIGVEQMKKLPWIVSERLEKANKYDKELKNIEWLVTPSVPPGYKHSYQSYVILIRDRDAKSLSFDTIQKENLLRNKFASKLKDEGIATRQGTHAVHTLSYYKTKYNIKDVDYVNCLAADRLSITLPLYPQMTEEEQNYVIEKVKHLQ